MCEKAWPGLSLFNSKTFGVIKNIDLELHIFIMDLIIIIVIQGSDCCVCTHSTRLLQVLKILLCLLNSLLDPLQWTFGHGGSLPQLL